jgi:hypothetical protein
MTKHHPPGKVITRRVYVRPKLSTAVSHEFSCPEIPGTSFQARRAGFLCLFCRSKPFPRC